VILTIPVLLIFPKLSPTWWPDSEMMLALVVVSSCRRSGEIGTGLGG